MQSFLFLGLDFLKFWFFEAPKGLFFYFISLNKAFFKLFSLRILIKTYFKPWKNEYRKGLVGFAIFMGMLIKSFIITFDISVFLLLVVFEMTSIIAFILWPFATIAVLFL